jgi:cyanophycinase
MRFHSFLLTILIVGLCDGAPAPDDKAAEIVGTWETIDRHVAMGSLYQPVHGVRKREGVVHFEQDGDRLSGYAIHADHEAISHQERWKDGRTEFRKVSFADGRLVFEWDIGEWFPSAGPIAVEQRRLENKGTVRVEAALQGERLVGTWKLFVADGTEVFRGEWEAVRSGPVMLIGGRHQDLTAEIRKVFFELAGGTKAKIVIIPTGIASAEDPLALDEISRPWLDLKSLSVEFLHTRDRKMADDPAFVKPLTEATAVFFTNGHLHRLTDVYPGTLVEKELKELQRRGGVVGGTGSGAAVLGDLVINRPHADQPNGPGLGLVPHFAMLDDDTERGRPRLLEGAVANPDHVGLTIDPGTAVVIRGTHMRVIGEGSVTIRLAKGAGQEAKIDTLKSGGQLDVRDLQSAAAAKAKK